MPPIEVSWPGLVDRLRAWPRSLWRPDRVSAVLSTAQQLVDLTAAASSQPARQLPRPGHHALADLLAVAVADARDAAVDPARIRVLLGELAAQLGFRLAAG